MVIPPSRSSGSGVDSIRSDRGWRFQESSQLRNALIKAIAHGKAEPIKLAWMYMSLPVGIVFLISVNIELILRNILTNFTKLNLPEDYDKQKLETQ